VVLVQQVDRVTSLVIEGATELDSVERHFPVHCSARCKLNLQQTNMLVSL